MDIYFKNIRVLFPNQNIDRRVSLLISDGIFSKISEIEFEHPGAREMDGRDLVLCPGFFDMHVHLREPGQEYKETIESGCDTAANGGFTGVVCMPNTIPAIDSVVTIEYIKSKSRGNLVDVYPCGALTKERKGTELAPLLSMHQAGAVIFSDDGACLQSPQMMRMAMEFGSTNDLLFSQHCEEHSMTVGFDMNESAVSFELGLTGYPSVAEELIVARDIMLAEFCGNRRYHVSHLSTSGSVELVRQARARGQRVSAEVTPHHFTLTDDACRGYNTNAKMNPPLRGQHDVDAIKAGLEDGSIEVIATDHAPHATHEKDVEFSKSANGITGLETSIGLALTRLFHSGTLPLGKIVETMSVNPRRILQLEELKFEVGAKANFTVIAPDQEWTFEKTLSKSLSHNTPFHGTELKGKPIFSFNNGLLSECIVGD